MNGPEHYREAERLLDDAQGEAADLMKKMAEQGNLTLLAAAAQQHANIFAAAQVHATLALAAATAQVQGERFADYVPWPAEVTP